MLTKNSPDGVATDSDTEALKDLHGYTAVPIAWIFQLKVNNEVNNFLGWWFSPWLFLSFVGKESPVFTIN